MDMVVGVASAVLIALLAVPGKTLATEARPTNCGTQQWQSLIAEAAQRFDLPQAWLHAVMRAESAGCTHLDGQPITSSAGAMGLMQLMPATWKQYRERLSLGDDPHAPSNNILAGAAYLHDLYDAYGHPGLFAAYHAGPGRYEDSLAGGRSLPKATLEYLVRVQSDRTPQAISPAAEHATGTDTRSVFVTRKGAPSHTAKPALPSHGNGLFIRLSERHRRAEITATEAPHVQPE